MPPKRKREEPTSTVIMEREALSAAFASVDAPPQADAERRGLLVHRCEPAVSQQLAGAAKAVVLQWKDEALCVARALVDECATIATTLAATEANVFHVVDGSIGVEETHRFFTCFRDRSLELSPRGVHLAAYLGATDFLQSFVKLTTARLLACGARWQGACFHGWSFDERMCAQYVLEDRLPARSVAGLLRAKTLARETTCRLLACAIAGWVERMQRFEVETVWDELKEHDLVLKEAVLRSASRCLRQKPDT